MSVSYSYATGPLIDERNTYFYSQYHGLDFLLAWRDARDVTMASLAPGIPPRPPHDIKHESLAAEDLLEMALAGDAELLARFVRKFEITKRVHRRYDQNLRAVDKMERYDLKLYLRAADLFEASYSRAEQLIYLNVYLKVLDTVCAYVDQLSSVLKGRLAWHIERERRHVLALARRHAIPL